MGERSRRGLCPLDPRAASGWPAAKVGGALSRMNERAYSIPPGAAPRAQCLCRRVSGTESDVRSGRHGHFCAARSAHGEAENCAALPRTRAARANVRNGRCFPPCVPGEPSGFIYWERPQPELSLQLVYLLGAAVTCGYWQGTPGDTAWSSGPQGRVRVADSSRGRGAERPRLRSADRVSEANRRRRLLGRRSAVARSALRASAEGVLSGFRPFGPGRMATPYGESKGGPVALFECASPQARSASMPGQAAQGGGPLSALLPPTSWARKKSARPPGRVPAIHVAAGGSPQLSEGGRSNASPGAARII